MRVLKVIFLTIFILFISVSVTAQSSENEIDSSLSKNNSVEAQFNSLEKSSNSYQDYKVVKKKKIKTLKSNVLDSLKVLKATILEANQLVVVQANEIKTLKDTSIELNSNLVAATKEKDIIHFLGIPLTKGLYNTLLWLLIFSLIFVLVFFMYKFKNSNAITKVSNKTLEEVRSEFEMYKSKALEREQKARRALQDELNKQKYSSSRGKKD